MNLKHKLSNYLKSDSHLSETIKGSALAFLIKVLAAGFGFLLNVIIARQLGADEAGIYFLGFTIITIIATIGRVGFDNTLVRYIAAAHSENKWLSINAIYRFGMGFCLIISSIFALLLSIFSEFISISIFNKPNLYLPLQILSISVPFLALFTLHSRAFQGLKKIPQNLFLLSLSVPFLFICLATIAPISAATEASYYYLIVSGCTLICGIFLWWIQSDSKKGTEPIKIKSILHSCIPLLTVQILNLFTIHTGQIFLGAWNSSSDVAIFNAAQKTALLTSFILIAVNSISAPKFSALHHQGKHLALSRLAVQSAQLMTILAFPALLVMIIFPDFLLSLFGEEFRQGALVLVILALGQFINVATGSVGYLLMMTGNEKVLRNNTFISALVSISLGLWLIPAYGLMGAAISTAITVATANLLSCWRVYQKLGFWTLPFTKPMHIMVALLLLGLLIVYIILSARNLSFFELYSEFIQNYVIDTFSSINNYVHTLVSS